MNQLDKLAHTRELNRLRQARYYANNKEKVCDKKKQDRAELKRLRGEPVDLPASVTLQRETHKPVLQTTQVSCLHVSNIVKN